MKKTFYLIIIITMGIYLMSPIQGCQDAYVMEKAKLDTLDMHLNAAKENLDIDIKLIEQRLEEITEKTRVIKNNIRDSVELEFSSNMERYRALFKIYRKNIEEYDHWKKEYEELVKQAADLRNSLGKEGLNREEFKQYYYKEEADIIQLRDGSQQVKKSLYEIEPEYMRLSDYTDNKIVELDSLAKLH